MFMYPDFNVFLHFVLGFALTATLHLTPRKRWGEMMIIILIIPALIEAIQYFVPGRACDVSDLLASWGGIAFGFAFLPYLPQWKK